MISEARLCFSLGILKHFIDNSLGLNKETFQVTGFDLVTPLLDSAAYNTYLETVSNKTEYPYLIFVPKQKDKQEILFPMEKDEHIAIIHDFSVNKDKTKYNGETFLAFLK
ncbi:MAG: hypothetical protein AABX34_02440, partial [Nanoarchaeota archaeon]